MDKVKVGFDNTSGYLWCYYFDFEQQRYYDDGFKDKGDAASAASRRLNGLRKEAARRKKNETWL